MWANSKLPLTLVVVASLLVFHCAAQDVKEDNKKSTLKIMGKACVYPSIQSNEQAEAFMACYDQAPGKDIFTGCQQEAFGKLFDSVKNFRCNCAQAYKIPKYAKCLSREFEAQGLDQDDAVTKVNACQLPVVSQ